MTVFTLGPLSIDARLLINMLALLVTLFVVARKDKQHRLQAETTLWWVVVIAVVAGRLAFVVTYWSLYQYDWFGIIDLRDGGFSWLTALLVAGVSIVIWWLRQPKVRPVIFMGLIAGGSVWGAGWLFLQWQTPEIHFEPAEISLLDLEKNPITLTPFIGKPIVINIWASWCPPCRREMPVLQKAQQNNSNIHVVFANQAESAQVIQHYLQKEGLQLDHVFLDSTNQLAELVGSRGLPTTLFIDADGTIQTYRLGELSEATLDSHIRTILP